MSRHQLKHHWGGWNRQQPDWRDREFLPSQGALDVQQTEFTLNIDGIPLIDQGQQGSCTGHGTAGLVMYDQKEQYKQVVVPARAMIYYDARIPEGTVDQDAGATVRDAVGGVVKYGVVPDSEFPYDASVFNRKPSDQDYQDAKKQEALVYEAVKAADIEKAIASGFPVVFGFTVYESFESQEAASTGVIPVPGKGEQVLGGHCVWAWGFNTRQQKAGNDKLPAQTLACRNSWGESWGDHGNFYLPLWYWDNGQADDAWVIRRIGAGK